MALFDFKVITNDDRLVEDTINASSLAEAQLELSSRGWTILFIDRANRNRKKFTIFTRVKLLDLAIFCRYFAVLIKGGVRIVSALGILEVESKNPRLRYVLSQVRADITGGYSLRDAMNRHRQVFSQLMIDSIDVGEKSGKIYETLDRLAGHFERTIEVRRRLRDAMIYPTVLSVLVVILVTYILTGIIPNFQDIYDALGGELPLITQHMLAVGLWLRANLISLTIGVIAVILAAINIYYTEFGRWVFDWLGIRVPMVRTIVVQYNMSQFMRALSMLYSAGFSFIRSLGYSRVSVANRFIRDDITRILLEVEQGSSIGAAFNQSQFIPAMTCHMIKVGDTAGSMKEMMESIVNFYDEEFKYAVEAFLRTMEPAIIITLGLVVLLILFSAYLPIFSMVELINP